ncbi:DUF3054 domain-containing protein [[Mycobacterium] burgundiense]|uniref:DUF3054 domain-containing protein n=1 Tax=[Mycobacterium] burgundiense TaxID=3064286 RepID=A0ABM9M4L7_9MYCO|nr:DUF3054 domain-containing protein [Mycolicibacterium sp. MU0053]CAJ1510072.1 DUF3054 domain-containing protein [Mycolicibacterium sp. MU0053]
MNHDRTNRRAVAGAVAADTVAVLVFCALGRRSHDEGVDISGVAATAWPFLSGTAIGWLLSRGWRAPSALRSTGLTVWLSTVVVGMLIRWATSASVALPFVAVASSVTAVLLLGWRAVVGRGRLTGAR